MPLSVSIICRNNESTIGRTLESVAGLATEIVAVDSGSTDGTIALLEKVGARVIKSPWLGYVKTKQLALDYCTGPWVLCLDSDESLLPELAAAVRGAVETDDPQAAGYRVNRKVYYRDRPLDHAWQPEWRLRLVRKGSVHWTGLDPHDRLEVVPGSAAHGTADLPGSLRHDSISTFADFFAKQARHAHTMATSMCAEGQQGSTLRMLTSPAGAFLKQLVLKQAWRDGWPGLLAAVSTGAATLMKHAILIELSHVDEH
jgi:hypothetical protein